jgi:hypothetical protein
LCGSNCDRVTEIHDSVIARINREPNSANCIARTTPGIFGISFVRICLRKQVHYRARGGEWVQLLAEPYDYVCRTLFQAQMSRALTL